MTTLDVDGKPVLLTSDGTVTTRKVHDDRGNCIETAYFGVDGKPTRHKDGYAAWKARYDDRGNQIEIAYFGPDGKPTRHKDGNAAWRARYDERGNQVERAYFDAAGKPCLNSDSVAGWKSDFDERGREIKRSFFGVDGEPRVLSGRGYASWTKRYDQDKTVVEEVYFDAKGRPLPLATAVKLAVVAEVITESPAMKAGVQPGDVVLQYGSWWWNPNSPLEEIAQAIDVHKKSDKRVVVYRPEQGVIVHDFPPGMVGCRLVDGCLTKVELEQMKNAYTTYKAELTPGMPKGGGPP